MNEIVSDLSLFDVQGKFIHSKIIFALIQLFASFAVVFSLITHKNFEIKQ